MTFVYLFYHTHQQKKTANPMFAVKSIQNLPQLIQ